MYCWNYCLYYSHCTVTSTKLKYTLVVLIVHTVVRSTTRHSWSTTNTEVCTYTTVLLILKRSVVSWGVVCTERGTPGESARRGMCVCRLIQYYRNNITCLECPTFGANLCMMRSGAAVVGMYCQGYAINNTMKYKEWLAYNNTLPPVIY